MVKIKIKINIKRILLIFKETTLNFLNDDCFMRSASLSYYALLSSFPLIILMISVLGSILKSNKNAFESITNLIKIFTPAGYEKIKALIESIVNTGNITTIIGFVSLVWILLIFFGGLENNFNFIWKVVKRRQYLKSKLIGLLLTSSFIFLVLITVFFSNNIEHFFVVLKINSFIRISNLPAFFNVILYIIKFIFLICVFALFYKFVPSTFVKTRAAIYGGIFSSISFELARVIYRIYLTYFQINNLIYGSLFYLVVLVIWTNYTMIVLLYGCELTKVINGNEITNSTNKSNTR